MGFLNTEEVVRATEGILVNGDMGIEFAFVSTDTRTLKPGELFVALKGRRFDAHEFLRDAIEKGAKGLLVSRLPSWLKLEEVPKTVSVILVRDTLEALGRLASYVREREGFKAVGITGSCGKTTTKEMCAAILSSKFRVFSSPGNWNNLVGLPLSVFLSAKEGAEVGVFELGINAKGEMEQLGRILRPDVSAVTCVAPAHLEGLKTLNGVAREKAVIYRTTKEEGTLVIPAEEELLVELTRGLPQRKVYFGLDSSSEVRASGVEVTERGTEFDLFFGESFAGRVRLKLVGEHFVKNALCAAAIGASFGLEPEEVIAALEGFEGVRGRLQLKRKGSLLVIDDTYNANPASVKEALRVLEVLEPRRERRVVILGDMKELGESSRVYHEEVGSLAGRVSARVYAVGEFSDFVAKAAKREGAEAFSYSSLEELLRDLGIPEAATVLVKGSRAMEMEKVVERLLEEGR